MSKFKAGDRIVWNKGLPSEATGILTKEYGDIAWWVKWDDGSTLTAEEHDLEIIYTYPLDLNGSFDFEQECISVFEWVEANPGCHSANIRSEILRLLNQHRENKKG